MHLNILIQSYRNNCYQAEKSFSVGDLVVATDEMDTRVKLGYKGMKAVGITSVQLWYETTTSEANSIRGTALCRLPMEKLRGHKSSQLWYKTTISEANTIRVIGFLRLPMDELRGHKSVQLWYNTTF